MGQRQQISVEGLERTGCAESGVVGGVGVDYRCGGIGIGIAVEKNVPLRPMQIGLLGSQAVMLQPNNSPHPVKKFFRHVENPNEVRTIESRAGPRSYRKIARNRVGKSPAVAGNCRVSASEISGIASGISYLGVSMVYSFGVKKRWVSLLGQNSHRSIFSIMFLKSNSS